MLAVRRVSNALGAEIQGLDLSPDLDQSAIDEIERLLHEHEVIYFPGQRLSPEQHIRLSRRFGELEPHVRADCCRPGYPEIFVVSNVVEGGRPIGARDAGSIWHSDMSYKKEPSRASLFYAKEVPLDPEGRPLGDTLFASVTKAYEALPAALKSRIDGLKAVNSYAKGYARVRKGEGALKPLTEEQKRMVPDVEHPLVRTHPYTGKKCLFVIQQYTSRIMGLDPEESQALVDELAAHITKPEFVYRHKWSVGDFLIWDNCATQHCAVVDYDLPQRRLMERTTLRGSVPF